MLVSCSMKHIVEAIEGITLQCRDQLHQLLPLRQSGRVCIGEVYDQLEVCVHTVCLVCCRLGELEKQSTQLFFLGKQILLGSLAFLQA